MHSASSIPLYKKDDASMRSLTREQIALLVTKELCGSITPEEQALLDQWLNQESEEEMAWYSDDADELAFRKRLLKRIKEDAGIPDYSLPEKSISSPQRYRWLAAAGIFLLIVGGLSYFLSFRKNVSSVGLTGKVALQDIAPGHNGAILTLANGNKIVLDSAANGTIAMQGNHCIVKKKGQLAYEKVITGTPSKNSVNS